jgi:osmotically-inducible protein OsmY
MKRELLINVLATGALLATGAVAQAADYPVAPRNGATSQADMQITDNVKDKLATNDADVAPGIVVSTRDGIVTLKGIALTNDYITRAVFDARSVEGVVQVKNELSLQ